MRRKAAVGRPWPDAVYGGAHASWLEKRGWTGVAGRACSEKRQLRAELCSARTHTCTRTSVRGHATAAAVRSPRSPRALRPAVLRKTGGRCRREGSAAGGVRSDMAPALGGGGRTLPPSHSTLPQHAATPSPQGPPSFQRPILKSKVNAPEASSWQPRDQYERSPRPKGPHAQTPHSAFRPRISGPQSPQPRNDPMHRVTQHRPR